MLTDACMTAASYIIKRTNDFNLCTDFEHRIFLTVKRLQKLLYFSNIEYMKRFNGRQMFEDTFHAWPSGPVIPAVYHKYLADKQVAEPKLIIESDYGEPTQDMKNALDFILKHTWDLDTLDLIEMSKVEDGPWCRFYNDSDCKHQTIIPHCEIYSYYRTHSIFG